MRVFVTGATGFIGTAVVRELQGAGHTVLGLARNEDNVTSLTKAGVEVHRGELADLDSLVAGAKACDGIIHLGFVHDFANFMANIEIDRQAVEALTGVIVGSGKPMVIASGTMMVSHAILATETDEPASREGPRAAAEYMVLETPGIRGSVVRLAPSVHDKTKAGLVTIVAQLAKANGVAAYIGDGANRWPAVHVLDAARLFLLALERAEPGARLHGVGDDGIPMRQIAEAIGAALDVPVMSVGPEAAFTHFGNLAMFAGVDNHVSNAITRQSLSWAPREIGLLEDIQGSEYVR